MSIKRALIVLCVLFIFGCSSDDGNNDSTGYFLKFNIGSETIEFFETSVFSTSNPSNDYYQYSLNAGDGNSGFTINIVNNVPIETGQELTEFSVVGGGVPQSYLSYALPDDDTYTYSSWIVLADNLPTVYVFSSSVNITNVTSNSISGTFSGTMGELYNESNTVMVTDGSFKVRRRNN